MLLYDGKFIRFFFFQAEDGIRDYKVTGVKTCALPITRLGLKLSHIDPLFDYSSRRIDMPRAWPGFPARPAWWVCLTHQLGRELVDGGELGFRRGGHGFGHCAPPRAQGQ